MTTYSPTDRYINPETSVILWVAAIANYEAPTLAELTAGTHLEDELAGITGFTVTDGGAETPDWGSRFTSSIPGMLTVAQSTLTLYADKAGADFRTLMPRNTSGFLVFMDGGNVTGQPMDVWPVTVASVSKLRTASDPAKIEYEYRVTKIPAEDIPIPAT